MLQPDKVAFGRSDVDALRQCALFSGFSPEEFRSLLEISRYCYVREDTEIFKENEPCAAFYFVAEGLVRLSRTSPDGKLQVVEFTSPGETFAEAAMFSGQGYPVTATALLNSRLIEINAFRFMRQVHGDIGIAWKMLGNLSMRLHRLVGNLATNALRGAEQKVSAYLLDHEDPETGEVPNLPARRTDLANRVGVTVETLCRVLSGFRKKGWIETKGSSYIRVIDTGALQQVLVKNENCVKTCPPDPA
ncbi:MAG: Crp/Fnr family transcriptional regulator [Pseudomonadota bacterium]